MNRQETPEEVAAREAVLLYMRGFKHGAAASAKVDEAPHGPYSLGYDAGTEARRRATSRAFNLFDVDPGEAQKWVLR
jgi:hypothetical protein